MGIPAYFSYIIKNYVHVLKSLQDMRNAQFDNLYMDCNSIIYDAVREIYKTDPERSASYPHILALVCSKVQEYIDQIRPSNTIYIAFDGVAPVLKMEQQRRRRILNKYLEQNGCVEKSSGIDTGLITPGTYFMKFLSKYVNEYKFKAPAGATIIISASDQRGEGEHKLFEHIRKFKEQHVGKNTVIYGLDADLLMLSIFHKQFTKLYVFRETPEFVKSLNIDLKCNTGYLIDIDVLCSSIYKEMKMPIFEKDGITETTRIHDYAFLCFMLGNDFLPHIPVIDIRIDGIQVLMDAYRNTIGNGKLIEYDTAEIIWSEFNKVIDWIAKREDEILERHAKIREKQDRRLKPGEHRMGSEEEKYKKKKEAKKEKLGYGGRMLWVLKYYVGSEKWEESGKVLVKRVNEVCEEKREKEVERSYKERTQKNYVMSSEYIEEEIMSKWSKYWKWNGEMKMGYRKYIWEGDMNLAEITLKELDEIEELLKTIPEPNND
jgi:5'-3' exonuclease